MLDEHGIDYRYREYRKEPLSQAEIARILDLLGATPRDLLRTRDRAYRELGLTGTETDAALIAFMAEHPTLLQRPIAVTETSAVLGRPVENLLSLTPS